MSGLDTQTHTHTHTQYDYRNPRCACAPRVKQPAPVYTYERTCRSELTSAVEEMGCCINVLQDFYESISSNLDNSNLYRVCGVSIPGDCNNSPIGSSSAGSPLGLSLAGLISTVLLSAIIILDNS